jgi:putative transposase
VDAAGLRREWNRAKHQVAPWWPENSKEAYNSGLDALARALRNWNDSRNRRRKGRPMGFPRRKKKRRARATCRFTTGAIRVLPDRKHVQLPRIGVVKTHESTRKLARRLEQGTARILAATITRRADRWYVSFTVEVERAIPTSNRKPSAVGVDVGVRNLAVLSTGAVIPNPGLWNTRCASSAGSTGSWPVARWAPGVGAMRVGGWPGSTPARPTCGVMRCTSSLPASPPSTTRWSWST